MDTILYLNSSFGYVSSCSEGESRAFSIVRSHIRTFEIMKILNFPSE